MDLEATAKRPRDGEGGYFTIIDHTGVISVGQLLLLLLARRRRLVCVLRLPCILLLLILAKGVVAES